jgi:hypothetical protein
MFKNVIKGQKKKVFFNNIEKRTFYLRIYLL